MMVKINIHICCSLMMFQLRINHGFQTWVLTVKHKERDRGFQQSENWNLARKNWIKLYKRGAEH